ncbi:jg12364 [Pararge aegeria aegeria]|uniref:Jg12364 protein n=1 Tax=Pararge aegeria aegeria TaxID=348720 RepID=A0A8S4SCQ5_9NEOP|nr:jg12364 [Pararge aegeria aegeria]
MAHLVISRNLSPINRATLHKKCKEHVPQHDLYPSIGGIGVKPHVSVITLSTTSSGRNTALKKRRLNVVAMTRNFLWAFPPAVDCYRLQIIKNWQYRVRVDTLNP